MGAIASGTPLLTTDRTLGAGSLLRAGAGSGYRSVGILPGEPHVVRTELAPHAGTQRRGLVTLAHLTDLQLADVQSPARFEFLNREAGDPWFAKLVPVQRPQEALTAHAVAATVRTVNALAGGPLTGTPLELAVTTGDAIDNAQWNELRAFLALLDGGPVRLLSGGGYRGVQSLAWPDDIFWRPDGDGPDGPDLFRRMYAFGHRPGLIEQALAEFRSEGLRVPWLACYGNHEALIQGVGVITPELAAAMVGGRKPVRLRPDTDRAGVLETFTNSGHAFFGGDELDIDADPDRRPVTRREFVEAHFSAGARPHGHGFTGRNVRDGTAYYTHDRPGIRLIALDTTCLAGAADGCLGPDQLDWLGEQLIEVHSAYVAPDGSRVTTGNDDRLVVLFSHHGLDTLTNTRGTTQDGEPAVGAVELEALLHRFGNVVLWLNGHTHTNGVRARCHPTDPGRGFWEVTTCAIVDWPCQSRVVELIDGGDDVLVIACTMLDHDAVEIPADDGRPDSRGIAALHRELSGNVPWAGFDSPLGGTRTDRNVLLPMRAPFPLARITDG